MDNLALSNVLTTPAIAVAATNTQGAVAPADTVAETPFGDVLARQLAMVDAQQANPKDVRGMLVDAKNVQLQLPGVAVQPIDIIQQIVVDPALLMQQASVTTGQVLSEEALVDVLKKADKSDGIDVGSEQLTGQQLTGQQLTGQQLTGQQLTGQQGVASVIVNIQAAGNLQPSAAALGEASGKDLPVSVIGASALGSLSTVVADAKLLASGDRVDADSAEVSASFAARLESVLAADGAKSEHPGLVVGGHGSTSAVVEKVAVAAPTSAGIPQQVGSPHWETGLGDKVVWMIGSQTQSAQLHLNPPNLGPLEIKLSMADGQASLSFVTQHAVVRDAIEAASPRLRDMMGESGISMGSVSVNVGSFSQQQQAFQQNNSSSGSSENSRHDNGVDAADIAGPAVVSVQSLDEQGLVNLFA